jgi:serine/threonine protein kinase
MLTNPGWSSIKQSGTMQRKVVIDDFEMMRVLGKGCAGKVLLVRHKSTVELYALKAITKHHVLAHQELQHTLTEDVDATPMQEETPSIVNVEPEVEVASVDLEVTKVMEVSRKSVDLAPPEMTTPIIPFPMFLQR